MRRSVVNRARSNETDRLDYGPLAEVTVVGLHVRCHRSFQAASR
jgi:hypothetical protein